MDNFQRSPRNKYESSLVFPDYINRIWKLLKEKAKIIEICIRIRLIIADNQKKSNHYLLNNISCLELETKTFNKSVTYVLILNNNTTVNIKFLLYPNTSDNSTLIILELTTFYEEQNENYFSQIPKMFLNELTIYLKKNPVFLYEYESIILNCDIVPIWDFFINETNFEQNFTDTNKKVIKHNDLKKLGGEFIYKLNENEIKIAKVTKIERDFLKKQWTFMFDLFNTKDDINAQCEVGIFLLITKENNIFLSYNHDFKIPIEQSELNVLAKNKKHFLNEIKNYFEKK